MANNKVYFSKSNAVSNETVEKIRRYILKFDVELKEFTGGTYSNTVMDECEFLIVLPPSIAKKRPGVSESVKVGRGIYQQTQYFYNTKRKINNILIITAYGLCENKDIAYIEFGRPDYWDIKNEKDYVNYGEISISRIGYSNMTDYFILKNESVKVSMVTDVWDDMSGEITELGEKSSKHEINEELESWDSVYSSWFNEKMDIQVPINTGRLIINPEDPDDYSLLLAL